MANSTKDPSTQRLRSVFTSTLLDIFKQLNISLVVSTYQAGKVILVRHDQDSNSINTHFRNFAKPMGIAVKDHRLSIGATNTIWEYRNLPAVAAKLEPPGKHDACYLPRSSHITGDIDVHEMAWSEDNQLWLVNTRFDCLCTIDADHSFTPRWRPNFISALAPEDRCHLNGMAMVNGKPKYVTALGKSDTPQGWREAMANGGVLIDIDTNQTLLAGLSMPHSPRWYQDCLWLLESGYGTLKKIDVNSGTNSAVANLNGFTRGLDFYGPLAFIGLSQVRESAHFSGIPIVDKTQEPTCGVWVVHIETGQTLGFLRFESGVEEIFDVQIISHSRFPELLEWEDPKVNSSYVVPEEVLAKVSPIY